MTCALSVSIAKRSVLKSKIINYNCYIDSCWVYLTPSESVLSTVQTLPLSGWSPTFLPGCISSTSNASRSLYSTWSRRWGLCFPACRSRRCYPRLSVLQELSWSSLPMNTSSGVFLLNSRTTFLPASISVPFVTSFRRRLYLKPSLSFQPVFVQEDLTGHTKYVVIFSQFIFDRKAANKLE